jgi:hypothetical protein
MEEEVDEFMARHGDKLRSRIHQFSGTGGGGIFRPRRRKRPKQPKTFTEKLVPHPDTIDDIVKANSSYLKDRYRVVEHIAGE